MEVLFSLMIVGIGVAEAIKLTKTPDIACPNEVIQFHCITEGQVLEWQVRPLNEGQRSATFLSTSTSLHQTLSWPNFAVELQFLGYNTTHMSSMARVQAIPAIHNAEFDCSGYRDHTEWAKVASRLPTISNVQVSITQVLPYVVIINLQWQDLLATYGNDTTLTHYVLKINQNITLTNSTSVQLKVPHYNESGKELQISIYPINCAGRTPALDLNFNLITPNKVVISDYMDVNTTTLENSTVLTHYNEVTVENGRNSTSVAGIDTPKEGFSDARIIISVAVIAGVFTGIILLLVSLMTVLFIKKKKISSSDVNLSPDYDEIYTSIQNDAYNITGDLKKNCQNKVIES